MLDQPAVTTTIAVIDLCPNCETAAVFEDRDGILSCPNCGCPQEAPHGLSFDEWETLPTMQPEQLDEEGWTQLLAHVHQLNQAEA